MNSLSMTSLRPSGAGKATVPGRLGRWLAIVGISLGLVALGETALAQRGQLDRIIAIVDDDVVLKGELAARIL